MVRDVVSSLAINPNTVLKAYKELETRGLAVGRPGQGAFVQATLSQVALPEPATPVRGRAGLAAGRRSRHRAPVGGRRDGSAPSWARRAGRSGGKTGHGGRTGGGAGLGAR